MEQAKAFFEAATTQATQLSDRIMNSLLTNRRWQAITVMVVALTTSAFVLGLSPGSLSQ